MDFFGIDGKDRNTVEVFKTESHRYEQKCPSYIVFPLIEAIFNRNHLLEHRTVSVLKRCPSYQGQVRYTVLDLTECPPLEVSLYEHNRSYISISRVDANTIVPLTSSFKHFEFCLKVYEMIYHTLKCV